MKKMLTLASLPAKIIVAAPLALVTLLMGVKPADIYEQLGRWFN